MNSFQQARASLELIASKTGLMALNRLVFRPNPTEGREKPMLAIALLTQARDIASRASTSIALPAADDFTANEIPIAFP